MRQCAPSTSCLRNIVDCPEQGGIRALVQQEEADRSAPIPRPSNQSVRPRLPPNRSLESKPDSAVNLCPRTLDRTQILQLLVNLMRNGIEAMESSQDERVLRINASPTNVGIRIEISDLGIGLTEFENIFEPFVSAKINGMGMGLAICRSIVEGHGGRLSAEPNQPKGAKFIINLPTGL